MFALFQKKAVDNFSAAEKEQIVQAIRAAELTTSGEVRVYIENRCAAKDAIERARELFLRLKMHQTEAHNAVLVYVALKDKKLAVLGDEGIHQKVGNVFWEEEVKKMLTHFNQNNYAAGIATVVQEIGTALQTHFPYNSLVDKNELPDDIVFGK